MKLLIAFLPLIIILLFCFAKPKKFAQTRPVLPLADTWKLLTGTLTENGRSTTTDYTKKISFIKIINDTHFAFLEHDLNKGKDSAVFVASGGSYTLKDTVYTEHLEYCNDCQWEGNDFTFSVSIKNDTLTQVGIEKVESAGITRINTEKYVRINY